MEDDKIKSPWTKSWHRVGRDHREDSENVMLSLLGGKCFWCCMLILVKEHRYCQNNDYIDILL